MDIKGVNIMNKNLNKLIVNGLMVAAVFGLGLGNQAVQAASFDQGTISVAHVMSTGSNQSNASNASEGENVSLSPAHSMSTGSGDSNN